MLKKMEKEINKIYDDSPKLTKVLKKYLDYMSMVEKRTKKFYDEFKSEQDTKLQEELKKAYTDEIKRLTVDSKQHSNIVKEFVGVLAEVNQEALDIVNDSMSSVYAVNYNQVAEDCRNVGIDVI